jgi:hypothetical protein
MIIPQKLLAAEWQFHRAAGRFRGGTDAGCARDDVYAE